MAFSTLTDNDDTSYIEKEQKKKKYKIILWIVGITLYLLISFYFFHFFKVLKNVRRETTADVAIIALKNMLTKPAIIFPLSSSTILIYSVCSALLMMFLIIKLHERALKKHDNADTVNGEARLMNAKDLRSYNIRRSDPIGSPLNNGPSNMILSKDIFLAMDGRKTRRNCNILVIGGSGAGKSRFFAGPNILNFNSNFVITDPSGELLRDYGKALENNGFAVKVFNLTDVYKSSRYNPFHYIREEKDVFILVNTLIKNTNPSEGHAGDPFWEKCEKLLLQALILYLWHEVPEEEQTFTKVIELIDKAEIDENNASAESDLDKLFKDLSREDPNNLAALEYRNFKKAAGKTLKSIIISVVARMESFMLSDIQYLTNADDLHLESFADTKQALFVIIPTADTTFNFLVSLLYSQLFMSLYTYVETRVKYGYQAYIDNFNILKVVQADDEESSKKAKEEIEQYINNIKEGTEIVYNEKKSLYEIRIKKTQEVVAWRGEEADAIAYNSLIRNSIKIRRYSEDAARCPYHVRFILDEFANIGQIPDFNEKLATIRKYEISCSIILQALSQLKKMYKDDWNTIVANCDTKLFLGCDDQETIKWLVEMLGKKTTTVENMSMQNNGTGSSSYNKSSRDLLTIEQITMMKDNECVVRIRGERPYFGKKYDIEKHPNYEYAKAHAGQFVIPSTGERSNSHIPHRLRKKMTAIENSVLDAENPVESKENESMSVSVPPSATPKKENPLDTLRRSSKNTARKRNAEDSLKELEEIDNALDEKEAALIQSMLDSTGLTASSTSAEIKEVAQSIVDFSVAEENDIMYEETE